MSRLDRLKAALRVNQPRPEMTLAEIRAGMEDAAAAMPVPPEVQVAPAPAGLPGELVSPPDAPDGRTVLYLHGGGFVMGSPNTVRALAGRIALAASARVVTLDYRLAPEHPFPAALDDCVAAYRALLDAGVPAGRLAVAGDSAGGGLTLATLVAARDAGVELPAGGVCISPWADLVLDGVDESAVDPVVSGWFLRRSAGWYAGDAAPSDPRLSPVFADLRGLPPLLLQAGEDELLVKDATLLAERAEAVGVDVTLEVWDEMVHVWQVLAPKLPEANQAINRIGEWLDGRWR